LPSTWEREGWARGWILKRKGRKEGGREGGRGTYVGQVGDVELGVLVVFGGRTSNRNLERK